MNTMLEEELEEPNNTPPKLLLLSQRFNKPDLHDGFSSPPQTIATIPFQWELTPGKPRSTTNDLPVQESKSIRSLDLPPRMFISATSPTTVLHGPHGGMRSLSFNKPDLHDGFSSPPQTIATIPFQWELTPGKPRSTTNDLPVQESKSIRSLDLPPRMFISATSPTTVLHGPHGGMRSLSSPNRRVGKSTCMMMPWGKSTRKETLSPKFSSWSWDSFQDISSRGGGGGGSSRSCSSYTSFDDLLNSIESKTRTNKVTRRHSFILFSRATSIIMESMHGSINQAVPWRR